MLWLHTSNFLNIFWFLSSNRKVHFLLIFSILGEELSCKEEVWLCLCSSHFPSSACCCCHTQRSASSPHKHRKVAIILLATAICQIPCCRSQVSQEDKNDFGTQTFTISDWEVKKIHFCNLRQHLYLSVLFEQHYLRQSFVLKFFVKSWEYQLWHHVSMLLNYNIKMWNLKRFLCISFPRLKILQFGDLAMTVTHSGWTNETI